VHRFLNIWSQVTRHVWILRAGVDSTHPGSFESKQNRIGIAASASAIFLLWKLSFSTNLCWQLILVLDRACLHIIESVELDTQPRKQVYFGKMKANRLNYNPSNDYLGIFHRQYGGDWNVPIVIHGFVGPVILVSFGNTTYRIRIHMASSLQRRQEEQISHYSRNQRKRPLRVRLFEKFLKRLHHFQSGIISVKFYVGSPIAQRFCTSFVNPEFNFIQRSTYRIGSASIFSRHQESYCTTESS
jgi:hypothetical protein